jgi:thiamine monophosphate kinase
LVPRDVPPLPEPQPDSLQYVSQGEDSFETVVTVPEKTHKKLNSCRRMTTTTMIMGRKKTMRRKKKRVTRLKVKMVKTTLP